MTEIGNYLETALVAFGNYAWGMPLLIILLGGGLFFTLFSRLLPYRYFFHAIDVLRGKYDDPDAPGEINQYQALSSAIAATVGMGNISGVAVAITMGGPGALFWMWVSAFLGMTTKFFTSSLAVMYRGKDSAGDVQGGPMYVITEGLGKKWKPLAIMFCVACLFGCLPIFQANQLTQIIRDVILRPNGWVGETSSFNTDLATGIITVLIVSTVIFGGIKRIGNVAGKMVPVMVVLYVAVVVYILIVNIESVPASFLLIFEDAFTGNAVVGGSIGAVMVAGARRAAFSNEAGLGTSPMMHGAAQTNEPIREGLVAMLEPAIDTLVVCTMTALAILVSGVWTTGSDNGISLTAQAFNDSMPGVGAYILVLCVLVFAFSTLFSYSYYGTKCTGFLFGAKYQKYYNYFYVSTIVFGATASLPAVIGLIDGMYAIMVVPTVTSAVLLSPKVVAATKDYIKRMKEKELVR
ncbi:alanine/glycine:cation symporter family protein [Flammeovirgaceae bacterium SG7u.111]|nr:alanine/glycine:cation symporter family protein [Flammeovirgaceae bacterium SG7u.132]WPO36129.1 alanine/glycine:cation symporter family protein [Flammeovirgaceae bacterium SG7u.111]